MSSEEMILQLAKDLMQLRNNPILNPGGDSQMLKKLKGKIMKKKKYKTDVVSFFKKEILTTRILVDNIRKKSWKESITIASLYDQKKFKPSATKANKSLHPDTRSRATEA